MARYDLSEAEWRIVEPVLPPIGKGKRREALAAPAGGDPHPRAADNQPAFSAAGMRKVAIKQRLGVS